MNRLLLFLFIAFSFSASAEDNSEIYDRIEKLERDNQILQKELFRKTGKKISDQVLDPSAERAVLEVKITELQEKIRDLNGKIEQIEFENKSLQKKIDSLSEDINFQLKEIKQGKVPENTSGKSSPVQNGKEVEEEDNDIDEEEDLYKKGKELLREGKYEESQKYLEKFIEKNPKNEKIHDAEYWLGETYFLRKDYQKSALHYLRAYKKNNKGENAASSLLKLGTSLGNIGKKKEACETFIKLKNEFPKTSDSTLKKQLEAERTKAGCK